MNLIHGDALTILPTLESASVDAIVADPPSGISFMGKEWDKNKGGRRQWVEWLASIFVECLRVARPGAVALVWAIPRTSHWTATALEDAGWDIEDRISHLFGTGFPKHKSKLKPACEDWWLCRKPGPKWLGVEECRIGAEGGSTQPSGMNRYNKMAAEQGYRPSAYEQATPASPAPNGRWPANVILDEEAAVMLDEQTANLHCAGNLGGTSKRMTGYTDGWPQDGTMQPGYGDAGGASRFFYCAKASKADRGEGNTHPTVKNTALMSWLVRLACPKGGTVLDFCMGSGSTGVACVLEGRDFIGIEKDAGYHEIATKRIAEAQGPLFANVSARRAGQ